MRKTFKWFAVILVVIVITAFAGVTAYAADFSTQADALKEMGLFKGTASGYELDRIPTRAEAAAALVRLLGKETEAQAGTYETPFTDVPDWAKPYVGYLYTNQMVKGTTDTTFGSSDNCSAQMFAAFVLRALGYSENGGDFTYSEVWSTAVRLGLTQGEAPQSFIRDHMVMLSYSALFQPVKGSETMLLDKLVADKAVDAGAADKYLGYYNTYQDFMKAASDNKTGDSLAQSVTTEQQITQDGKTTTQSGKTEMATVKDGDEYRMRIDSTVETGGLTRKTMMYFADGWMYMDLGETKVKYQATYNPDDAAQQSAMAETGDPFYLIQSIQKTETDSGVNYTIEFTAAMNDLLESVMSGLTSELFDMTWKVNSMQVVYNFDKDGKLVGSTQSGDVEMTMSIGQKTSTARLTFKQTSTVTATGSAVTVTPPPDLDQYVEIQAPSTPIIKT
jgi:hypothetical protein